MIEALDGFWTSEWLSSAFMLVALISTAIIIIVILSENRNPVKSLAWVTVLLLLPVVGIILYLFFGRNIKNTRMISRRNRRRLRKREQRINADPRDFGLSTESVQQINLGRSLSGAQFYPSNAVELFSSGKRKFNALMADIAAATHSINIQYYIIDDDETGNKLADLLIRKASEGVEVRIIYDHVGSFTTSNAFFRRLRKGGVEATPFFKVTFPGLGTHVNWRNHRKIVVIDESIAYIGGMNIANRYANDGDSRRPWRDTHIRVHGPVVAALLYSFAVDWNFSGRALFETKSLVAPDHTFGPNEISDVGAQLLSAGPTDHWSNIAMAYQKAISTAHRRVFIQTPYFLPTEGLLKALQNAALAHIDVRIMIPERADSSMLTHASASYIAECLSAGIKIYRYRTGMLHSKMVIIDDELVSIGSTNFDFRSFDYNFESNIFLYSKSLNNAATELFKADIANCTCIRPAEWRNRPFFNKAAESVLRLLSPVL